MTIYILFDFLLVNLRTYIGYLSTPHLLTLLHTHSLTCQSRSYLYSYLLTYSAKFNHTYILTCLQTCLVTYWHACIHTNFIHLLTYLLSRSNYYFLTRLLSVYLLLIQLQRYLLTYLPAY